MVEKTSRDIEVAMVFISVFENVIKTINDALRLST